MHTFILSLCTVLFLATPVWASAEIPHINFPDFKAEVMQSDKPVVIQFDASWCPYCRKLQPDLQALADERPNVKVVRINIDDNDAFGRAMEVRSLPTLFIYINGKEEGRFDGAPDRAALFDWVDTVIKDTTP